jgi:hypothetical protein
MDLSPCDFHVFDPFKKTVKSHRLRSDENIKVVVVH